MPEETYMFRCLELAAKGLGYTQTNPLVGAVLVHEGRIIGEGYHQQYGGPHAEVNAVASVLPTDQHLIARSTLYVSLEPCNHTGKTPPCTDLILRYRIPEVVVAITDPNEKVNGSGIRRLQEAGVQVRTGILSTQARWQNRRFFCWQQQQRPYVVLKWAQSADGQQAGFQGQPIPISHPTTNRLVHRWRSEEAAILVGSQTALTDNPRLTTRWWPGPNPVRVLIDRSLSVPPAANLLNDEADTLILNTVQSDQSGRTTRIQLAASAFEPADWLQVLYQQNMVSVLVEGGARILQSFIHQGCWDEARVITNTELQIGVGITAPQLLNAKRIDSFAVSGDRIEYFVKSI